MTKQAILEHAKKLSKQEQIELAMEVWDLLDDNDISQEITPELAAELDRRIEEDDADQSPAIEWKVLRQQLLRGEI